MSAILSNSSLFLLAFTCAMVFPRTAPHALQQPVDRQQTAVQGVWQLSSGTTQFTNIPKGATAIALFEDGYFTVAYFNTDNKNFIGTFGGTYTAEDGKLIQKLEYNTLDFAAIGTTNTLSYSLKNNQLQLKSTGQGNSLQQTWKKAQEDNAPSPLRGTWRITGRAGEDGTINPMRRGPRKTLKILSGNRFQWIAFNPETKQFSGTGGGTYTAEKGKYTENIEFFSRDSSRVGASLTFNFEVKNGKWHHSGQSSTGKAINEVWEREKGML